MPDIASDIVMARMNNLKRDWDTKFVFNESIAFDNTRDDKFSFVVMRYLALRIEKHDTVQTALAFLDYMKAFYEGSYCNLIAHRFIDYFWVKTQYDLYADLCVKVRIVDPIYIIDSKESLIAYTEYYTGNTGNKDNEEVANIKSADSAVLKTYSFLAADYLTKLDSNRRNGLIDFESYKRLKSEYDKNRAVNIKVADEAINNTQAATETQDYYSQPVSRIIVTLSRDDMCEWLDIEDMDHVDEATFAAINEEVALQLNNPNIISNIVVDFVYDSYADEVFGTHCDICDQRRLQYCICEQEENAFNDLADSILGLGDYVDN